MSKKSVLFVCTGNAFRSISAEFCFKQYLKDRKIKGWDIHSAVIEANQQPMKTKTRESLEKFGVNRKKIRYHQEKLTKKLLKEYDVIIAMAKDHLDYIKNKMDHKEVFLFNELAVGKETSILDVEDEIKNPDNDIKARNKKIEKTVKDISSKMPKLFEAINKRFYIFQEFTGNLRKHRNGFPFIKLHETKRALAFMSINIPSKEDGHILVIPKKRFSDVSDLPKAYMDEIFKITQDIGSTIKKNHGGYNILLNNGKDAGQFIYHVHFHIIPRKYNDGIEIEDWNKKKLTKEEFTKMNRNLKRQIKKHVS